MVAVPKMDASVADRNNALFKTKNLSFARRDQRGRCSY
jgi:hypothetical protein